MPDTTPKPDTRPAQRPVRTKIVATIGPASESPEVVRRLLHAGVSVFRFNFSHGTFGDHERRLATVRRVADELSRCVACLGDLQGPKIRVGKIPDGVGSPAPSGGGSITVAPGQDVVFKKGIDVASVRPGPHGQEAVLPVTYAPLVDEVQPGHRVLVNDGAIRMLAVERVAGAGELRCRVVAGGVITSGKGINLPHSDISAPAFTDRDIECARWAVEHDLDYLALSFVRKAEEVRSLRARLDELCAAQARRDGTAGPDAPWIPIVSKIEKPQALRDLDAIIDASDAVMVARGDLGVEMDIAHVPVAQKRIIATCAAFGKPCIVATQMLESMIQSQTPTRAEASDVANAVFDGADAVMLSAETATGQHPALVVETMSRILDAAEDHVAELKGPETPPSRYVPEHRLTAALAHGAWHIVRDVRAKAVVCWSQQGGTARYLSQNGFFVPIVACTSSAPAARRMALFYAVLPVVSVPPASGSLAEWNDQVDAFITRLGLASAGDKIVLLAGRPLGTAKATNTITVHEIGRTSGGYRGMNA